MNQMAALLLLILTLPSQAARANSPGRQLCGPIAVQMVLKSFGTDISLPRLTDEVFRDRRASTSSLGSLDRTLNAHGIKTVCIELDRRQTFDWPNPVIVHFPPTSERPDGHFAVVWPRRDRTDTYQVSMSPGDPIRMSAEQLATRRSQIVLLTSDSTIDTAVVRDRLERGPWRFIGWLFVGFVVAIVARQGNGIFRKRRIE